MSTGMLDNILPGKKKLSLSIDKKKAMKIAKALTGLIGVLAIVFISFAARDFVLLNKKSNTLTQLSNYNIQNLKASALTKDAVQNASDIKDVITLQQDTLAEKLSSIEYFSKLQTPYQNFLQYILFPSMNIWKDRYTNTIDTSIVGQSYLEKNPYMDNNLISHWTDFFRDIGRNTQYNEINDITIGRLVENANGSFTLPIDVSFSSSNKRSFLMLVDKLSITSNRGNISLINEFMYNLWEQIKQEKQAELTGGVNVDQYIGQGIYGWLYNDAAFVSEDSVDKAVLQTVGCTDNNLSFCFFKFREKFRSIPLIAYTLGFPGNNNATQLKAFLQYLPPVINVKQFSFQKKTGTLGNADQYVGHIQIDVFGRAISPQELDEISAAIGKQCFVAKNPMTPATALQYLQSNTKQFGTIARLSNEKSKDLTDLSVLFNKINLEYNGLPRYKQVVKLFELYRMLDDAGLCSAKQ